MSFRATNGSRGTCSCSCFTNHKPRVPHVLLLSETWETKNLPPARNLFESALERMRKSYNFVVLGQMPVMPGARASSSPSMNRRSALSTALYKRSSCQLRRDEPSVRSGKRATTISMSGIPKRQQRSWTHAPEPGQPWTSRKVYDWAWSSFRHYRTGLREPSRRLESFWTATKRGNQVPDSQAQNRDLGHPVHILTRLDLVRRAAIIATSSIPQWTIP